MTESIGNNPDKIKYVKGELLSKLQSPDYANLCAMIATGEHISTATFRDIASYGDEEAVAALAKYEEFDRELNEAISQADFTDEEMRVLRDVSQRKYVAKAVFDYRDTESRVPESPFEALSTNSLRKIENKITKVYRVLRKKYSSKNFGEI